MKLDMIIEECLKLYSEEADAYERVNIVFGEQMYCNLYMLILHNLLSGNNMQFAWLLH